MKIKDKESFWVKRKNAFRYAFHGIALLFAKETHAKIHMLAAVCVTVLGFIFHISPSEWCAIVLCISGMFMAEAFNTALEKICDKVSPQINSLIGAAKDIAAGAVLMFAIGCIIVGLIIFIPKFIA